jgi:hypothetical protein
MLLELQFMKPAIGPPPVAPKWKSTRTCSEAGRDGRLVGRETWAEGPDPGAVLGVLSRPAAGLARLLGGRRQHAVDHPEVVLGTAVVRRAAHSDRPDFPRRPQQPPGGRKSGICATCGSLRSGLRTAAGRAEKMARRADCRLKERLWA